jgi:hypothetical protein
MGIPNRKVTTAGFTAVRKRFATDDLWPDDAELDDERHPAIADVIILEHRLLRSLDPATSAIDQLELDAPGLVPWWSEKSKNTALGRVLIHMVVETQRHLGHADLVRELIDGAAGLRANNSNLPNGDQDWWVGYHKEVNSTALQFIEQK